MSSFFEILKSQFALLRITDFFDILIVSYGVYKALKFIRDTRTIQLLKGIVILIITMQVSYFANLHMVYYILSNAMQLGVIAIFIVFQPELRRALEQVGRSPIGSWFASDENTNAERVKVISEIVDSCQSMSKTRTGALIVIERDIKLGDIINTGIMLNSVVSSELLINIFIPNTPLHDGAVVIRNNKVEAATCFLPLSQNPHLSKELGTRHRAGLGISEESDAAVVIVSEETGKISLAIAGELNIDVSPETMTKTLNELLNSDKKDKIVKKGLFGRRDKA